MDILNETYLVKVKKSDRGFGKYLMEILETRLDSKLLSIFWNHEMLELTGEFEDFEEKLHELNLFRLSKRLCREITLSVQVRNGVSYGLHIGFPEHEHFILEHTRYRTAQTARAVDFGSQDRIALNLFLPELIYLKNTMEFLWDQYQEMKEEEDRKVKKKEEQSQLEKDKAALEDLKKQRKEQAEKDARKRRRPADEPVDEGKSAKRETKQEINRRLSSPNQSPGGDNPSEE